MCKSLWAIRMRRDATAYLQALFQVVLETTLQFIIDG